MRVRYRDAPTPARLARGLRTIHRGHCYKPGTGATRDVVYNGRICFAIAMTWQGAE